MPSKLDKAERSRQYLTHWQKGCCLFIHVECRFHHHSTPPPPSSTGPEVRSNLFHLPHVPTFCQPLTKSMNGRYRSHKTDIISVGMGWQTPRKIKSNFSSNSKPHWTKFSKRKSYGCACTLQNNVETDRLGHPMKEQKTNNNYTKL